MAAVSLIEAELIEAEADEALVFCCCCCSCAGRVENICARPGGKVVKPAVRGSSLCF